MKTEKASNAYDAMPYPPYSFPATHIGRLGAIGRIFGLPTAAPDNARMLELGCSSGTNLLAMAQLFPAAEFVGLDSSERQIESARETLAATGLTNVRFLHADIADPGEDLGLFDYVISHGIYSWVPVGVKEAILRTSRENLKPGGVAYVSYNVLPGWRMRGALRDMMLMHTTGIPDMAGKVEQGKALIQFLAESCAEDTPYGKYLQEELELLRNADDGYIAHEFFEAENDALYFSDFLKAAAAAQLQYLGDTEPATMIAENLSAKAAATLRSLHLNLLATEQYMDFLRNRMFRNTLLCHAEAALSRNIDPQCLADLHVNPPVALKQPWAEGRPAVFVGPGGAETSLSEPVQAELFSRVAALRGGSRPATEILEATACAFPERFAGRDTRAVRNDLGRLLIQGYFRRMVDFTLGPLSQRYSAAPAEAPEALPLARWQGSRGLRVSSPRLEMLTTDSFVGKFLSLCDGTRDRTALLEALGESFENNGPPADQDQAQPMIEELYDRSADTLRQLGILLPHGHGSRPQPHGRTAGAEAQDENTRT